MAFKDTLRKLMDEKNIKAVALSRETGLSEGVISEYLSGKKEPKGRGSISIAKALNVSLDELWDTEFKGTSTVTHTKKEPTLNDELTQELIKMLLSKGLIKENIPLSAEDHKRLVNCFDIVTDAYKKLL